MFEFKFELGQEVKDSLTGFTGTIIARCDHLTGCKQYLLIPKAKKESTKYPEGSWLDEDRLIKCKGKFKMKVKTAGGPQQHPDGL